MLSLNCVEKWSRRWQLFFNLQNISFASDGGITIQYISKNFKIVFYFYIYFLCYAIGIFLTVIVVWIWCTLIDTKVVIYDGHLEAPKSMHCEKCTALGNKDKKKPCRFLILIHNLELIYCWIKTICWLIKYSSLGLLTLIFMNLIIRNFKKKN